MKTVIPTTDYSEYARAWDGVTRHGYRHCNVDAWGGGRRYPSLVAIALSRAEAQQLAAVTTCFGRLFNAAVDGILADPDWWSTLAWPWPAIELARQEPPHPHGQASLFGRFDCLPDHDGVWQIVEYNADTPSGGREVCGLEPAIARLHPDLRRFRLSLAAMLSGTIRQRVAQHRRHVRLIGVVSSHSWLEDIAQAHWLAALLCRNGLSTIVGDVNDLATRRGRIVLRGRPIDALYRFYPIERLYRHAIFASLFEEAIAGRLLILNGLRGFLAQSKACLAWLWSNRSTLDRSDCVTVERHVPLTVMGREAAAACLLPDGVVKHVNGREGDSVVFGSKLDAAAWETQLLEGGYVVQRAVRSPAVEDVEADDTAKRLRVIGERYACVGAFSVGGRFAGCYSRLDGPITSSRAKYAATLVERT